MVPNRNFRAQTAFPSAGFFRYPHADILTDPGGAGLSISVRAVFWRKFFADTALYMTAFKKYSAFAADTRTAAGGVDMQPGFPCRIKQNGACFDPDLLGRREKGHCVSRLINAHQAVSIIYYPCSILQINLI